LPRNKRLADQLVEAASKNDLEKLKQLAQQGVCLQYREDKDEFTALEEAAFHGHKNIVERASQF